MVILAVLEVVVETLFLLSQLGKVIRFGPASAKKDKGCDKNTNDLFHISVIVSSCIQRPKPIKTLIRISLTFAG